MQIVIDIDEEDFNIMKHNVAIDNPLCPLGEKEMVTAVANGTPIPDNVTNGDMSYSQSQINDAVEVKAIPLDKVKQARAEIEDKIYNYPDRNISEYEDCLAILDKLIESEG